MTVISESISNKYEAVIGLEVHVQLSTNSKAFCTDSAKFGNQPNTNISPVSLGLPGALPYTNEAMIKSAVKLGLAINSDINQYNYFDRKNYFYADLPKGYQITQDNQPICKGGKLKIILNDNSTKEILLNRIHMEEDAGKSIHDLDDAYTYIDLNRAGVPLLEVVSEPVLSSGEEAAAYLSELRKLVRYLDICDGNMEEGSMRCDANISVREKGATTLGNRCEVKNLNSIKNVQKAIEHEIERQIALVEKGEIIAQNTLNFDANTGITTPLRSKEMANDYRYFPEPDLPPIALSDEFIEDIKIHMPALPEELVEKFTNEMNLPEYDARVITAEKAMADFYLAVCEHAKNYKAVSNWVMGTVKSYLNEKSIGFSDFTTPPTQIAAIINLVEEGKLNNNQAKDLVFNAVIANPSKDVLELAKELNVLINSNDDDLAAFIDQAVAKFPDKVKEYHNGKKGVIGLFMGEIMKISKGKIDPKQANKLLLDKIESLR
jgi:aspartyl-tRNA(Asn)/glutamyl-tRNA(Gln) amidotransferase subunit B